jgi:uncharacterized protein (TIGR03083 family)
MGIDYRSVIFEETAAIAELVRRGPLEARVPGCPDWSLAELAVHLGGVQRWATKVVLTGQPARSDEPDVAPEAAADYLAAGTPALIDALSGIADLNAPCWNFSGLNQTMGFWPRRQALEAAFHRWDAASALRATPAPMEAIVAADVVDEFVRIVIPRVVARTKAELSGFVGDVHLHCTDTSGEWTFEAVDGQVEVVDGHTKAAAAVRGSANDLALYLYGRVGADRVERFGDTDLVDRWLQLVRF